MILLAQAFAGFGLVHWGILIIVIAAVVGIVMIFLRQAGVTIPPFIIQVLWVVLAAIVCIAAIKFIASM
jgi:hypothetical protein